MRDDVISRRAAISLPVKPKEDRYFQTQSLDDAYEYGWRDLQGCIEKMPPAQPEIIRCKDCKHRPTIKDGFIVMTEETMKCPCDGGDYIHSWIPEDNFFCANGERREE